MTEPAKPVRCAVYTRKSTEEGLEQAFNSLDAQREACEAYVASQVGEGWRLLPARYDDGGFSGGNMERPAMRKLLTDIETGQVDVIVVYKVDRLTRSLMDFARIVERLDAKGVSFVSITQAFNTTSSMGRLTLNVLLSFAQFEREVTGERIRDKIAASKAKGIWMGGNVPLGYDLGDRVLLVNDVEAEQVRHIFRRYLAVGSGVALMKELRRDAVVSKQWTSRSGHERGGTPFSCGALYYLLRNRLYLGEIVHRDLRHAGEHDPIVEPALFDAVQQSLATHHKTRRERPTRSTECPLVGRIFDAQNRLMTTSFSYGRGGKLYRYYVSGSLDPSRSDQEERPVRISAGPIERLVLATFRQLSELGVEPSWSSTLEFVQRIQLNTEAIHVAFDPKRLLEPFETIDKLLTRLVRRCHPNIPTLQNGLIVVTVARKPTFRGGASGADGALEEGVAARHFRHGLRRAHELLRTYSMSPLALGDSVGASAPSCQRQRKLMSLGLIDPKLQKRILSAGVIDNQSLLNTVLPLAWADQQTFWRERRGPVSHTG